MAFDFTTLLTDLGNGIGGFIEAIDEPLVNFVIVLGVGAAVVLIVRAIASRVASPMKS